MALRIQKERMASGLLPSLREYAARYGLTASGSSVWVLSSRGKSRWRRACWPTAKTAPT